MPSENHLLAKKPAAGGGLPDGANLERLENKDQVNTTEDGYTLNCGRDKDHGVSAWHNKFRTFQVKIEQKTETHTNTQKTKTTKTKQKNATKTTVAKKMPTVGQRAVHFRTLAIIGVAAACGLSASASQGRMRVGDTGNSTISPTPSNPSSHFTTAQARQPESIGSTVPLQWLPLLLASSVAMPETDDGIDEEAEHETVLGCAKSVTEHSTTGRRMMSQHQVTAYSDDKQLFSTFDTDGDGYIVDFEALVKSGDQDAWRHSVEAYDADKDEKLGYGEFITLLADRRENAKEEQVSYDADGYEAPMALTNAIGRNDYEHEQSMGGSYYYESPAYRQLLAKRTKEIEAAEASVGDGMMSMSARHDHLGTIFAGADTNNDSRVSLDEYRTAGKRSRFAVVQGGFKEAVDTNGDGVVSKREALNAAAFEFDVIDGDRDGVVSSSELKHALENKGWLRKKDWHVAQTLATDEAMPHLITAYVETHWGDAPEEDYGDEEACEASKVGRIQSNAALADDTARPRESESGELSREHMNASSRIRRLGRTSKSLSKGEKQALMSTAMSVGYATVTNILATDFCWIKAYDRGVGIIAGCKSGWEQRGAMCYRICPSPSARHWHDIEYCGYPCRSGSTDIGLLCRTDGNTQAKTCCGRCWPADWCCQTWCCGSCPAGWTNTGCFCEPSWTTQRRDYSPGVTKFDGGVSGCANPSYPDRKLTPLGYFCYPAPKQGFKCQLTACQSICPGWMVQCGIAACSLSAATCTANVAQQAFDVGVAVASTAALIGSFGAAGAGGTQYLSSATRNTFRTAAKKAISGFRKQVVKGFTKAAIKAAIKKAVNNAVSDLAQGFAENVAALAMGAIVADIAGSTEGDMEKFDFTAYDPTGIASAVKATVDGGSSIDQAAAWTGAVGTFDPTGWVAASANFMKGTCDLRVPPSPPLPPSPKPPPPPSPKPPPPPVCAGSTATSGWVQYGTEGIYRDIDLSGCGFTSAPIISSSLAGSSSLWTAQGGSALYSISATGFRTYVYLPGITPSKATGWDWNINWIAVRPQTSASLCSSSTASSGWVQFGTDGIYRDIDLSGCGFTSAPIISSSLAGSSSLWTARGGTVLYSITATGFRTYVYLPDITPSKATGWNWNINWIAQSSEFRLILFNPSENARHYSSVYANDARGYLHARSMIGSPQAWSAATSAAGQWMYIDAGAEREVYGVVTQGRKDSNQWATTYKVDVYLSGSWVAVRNEAGSSTFTGNTDRNTQVQHRFSNSVTTRYVRFTPLSWHGYNSMRAGLLI